MDSPPLQVSWLDPQTREPLVEGPPLDPERAGHGPEVSAAVGMELDEETPLEEVLQLRQGAPPQHFGWERSRSAGSAQEPPDLLRPDLPLGGQGEPPDEVLEFSDVPGPGIGSEELQCAGIEPESLSLPLHLLLEVAQEQGNVPNPFPEGRQTDLEGAQPVVEVLAEPSLVHQAPQFP